MLKRRLATAKGFSGLALSFYDFPDLENPRSFASEYRSALDAAASSFADVAGIIEEAAVAFALNIELSKAVHCSA